MVTQRHLVRLWHAGRKVHLNDSECRYLWDWLQELGAIELIIYIYEFNVKWLSSISLNRHGTLITIKYMPEWSGMPWAVWKWRKCTSWNTRLATPATHFLPLQGGNHCRFWVKNQKGCVSKTSDTGTTVIVIVRLYVKCSISCMYSISYNSIHVYIYNMYIYIYAYAYIYILDI